MTLARFVVALAIGGVWWIQGGGPIQPGSSPRIEQLTKQIASGGPNVVSAFWATLAREHAPIVEPVAGDPAHVLVTFIWRGTADTRSVQAFGTEMSLIPKTDIWYSTIKTERDHRIWYSFKPVTGSSAASAAAGVPDPLNPHRFVPPVAQQRPASAINGDSPMMRSSILVLPDAPASPWVDPQPGVPAGRVIEHTYESRVFGGSRRLWIYTPPGADPAAGLDGVLICLWGTDYLNEIPVPTILDNLLHAGKIPRIAAVFVDNTGDRFQDFQSTTKFTESFSRELVPWLRTTLHLATDPHRTIVTGYSAAGLESTYLAFAHPELIGNVLSESGAFWRGFEGTGAADYEWLATQFGAVPRRDTKFFLDVGAREDRPAGGTPVIFKDANRHLRDVLVKQGYTVQYQEVPGAEHEFVHWRTSFADGLLFLTTGWVATK